jgi:RHS repeat-associated protein
LKSHCAAHTVAYSLELAEGVYVAGATPYKEGDDMALRAAAGMAALFLRAFTKVGKARETCSDEQAPVDGSGGRMKRRNRVTKDTLRAMSLCSLLVTLGAHAAEIAPADEYNKRLKLYQTISPGGETPFGEQISLHTGELSFRQTDVSFPGTGPDIVLTRSTGTSMLERSTDVLPLGNWDLSIPRIEVMALNQPLWTVGGSASLRCSNFNLPEGADWGAPTLITEDGERQPLLKRAPEYATKPAMNYLGQPVAFPAVTNANWQIGCLPGAVALDGGEGFLAVNTNGTKYYFTNLVYLEADTLFERDHDATIRTFRKFATMFVSKVEDRFGNTVTFEYAPANPRQLNRIIASDGREVTLTWRTDVPVVNSITMQAADTTPRTWQYQYAVNGDDAGLTGVILPDNSSWQFGNYIGAVFQLTDAKLSTPEFCDLRTANGLATAGPYVATITSPSGATGSFELNGVWHGRSYVPTRCNDPGTGAAIAGTPTLFGAVALTKRTITGPGLTPQVWTYSYSEAQGSAFEEPCALAGNCVDTAWTQVVDPDGDLTRHTYSTRWGISEGRSLKVETFEGTSTLVRTQSFTYAAPDQGPWPTRIGISLDQETTSTPRQEQWAPMTGKAITQQGVTFNWTGSNFDGLARVRRELKSSALGTKTDDTVYWDAFPNWVLGQISSTSTNGIQMAYTQYDAASVLPIKVYGPNLKLKQTVTYNADATVASVSDGRDTPTYDTTVRFDAWKRGIPQLITFPDGNSKSAAVNGLGLIDWVKDELGYKTCYAFDVMGRLTGIKYPSDTLDVCDGSRWNPLVRTFAPVGSAEFGLGAGHWKESVNTGNGYAVTYYDALWRPVVKEQFDSADKAGTLSQTVTRYDLTGRLGYQSYPMSGLTDFAAVTVGTRTMYDALGRATRVDQDSENGLLSTTMEYLTGFTTRTTSPRLTQTTTSYLAFDAPSTDLPLAITHPEGAYTDITRDIFGKPLTLTRRNASGSIAVTRSYAYDAEQRLCRLAEPETGVTLTGYDDADNVAWTASGLPTSVAACDSTGNSPEVLLRKSTRTYDNRNRTTVLEFADDIGEQVWTYTPDGLPNTVWTYNGPGRTIGVYNAYSYNSRRMLGGAGETLHQAGWYTWSLGYGYDKNGFVTVQTYPDTSSYNFAVNALGQTTGITGTSGTYVSGASYYPNGALRQFTYGNGIVHTLDQNLRGMPLRSKDAYAGVAVLDDSYDYDNNGNVAAISDGLPNAPGNRTMLYDGLDRLISSTAPAMWGGTISYTYDVLDNIETLVAPAYGAQTARNLRYCYKSGRNMLEFIRSGASSCTTGTATTTLDFDVQGNVWHKNQQEHTFTQDNRLRAVVGKETYRYDANGRRVTAEHPTLGFIRSFYNKSGQLSFQADARQAKNLAYVYLAGSLVATREQATAGGAVTLKFDHTDALGTPVAVTNTSRAVIEKSQYEPYGKLINRPIHDGPGYTGHVDDAQTGLTYMQQRYYDPDVGRLLSVDPVGVDTTTAGNFNRYKYANGNPYRFVDPDGRFEACPGASSRTCVQSSGTPLAHSVETNGEINQALNASTQDYSTAAGQQKEPLGTMTRGSDGKLVVTKSENVQTQVKSGKDTATTARPAHLVATQHGHIDKGARRSEGFVSGGEGGGDPTKMYLDGVPRGVVSEGRQGVYSAPDGVLRFELIDGSKLKPTDVSKIGAQLDKQQGNLSSAGK